MHTKKDFYRLLSVKHEVDGYLISVFRHWQQQNGVEKPEYYKTVSVIGYHKKDSITLRFDNNEELEFTLPVSYFHDKDDTIHPVMLWYSDYYDGPISGLAEYKGKKVWYQWKKDALEPLTDMRIFDFYELSDEEIEDEEQWHQYFREMVGHHCDYVEDQKGRLKYSPESFDKFYAEGEKRKKRDYTKHKIVATLDETFIDRGYPKKVVDND